MDDADDRRVGGEVNGVDWLLEQQDGRAYRFTTTLRRRMSR